MTREEIAKLVLSLGYTTPRVSRLCAAAAFHFGFSLFYASRPPRRNLPASYIDSRVIWGLFKLNDYPISQALVRSYIHCYGEYWRKGSDLICSACMKFLCFIHSPRWLRCTVPQRCVALTRDAYRTTFFFHFLLRFYQLEANQFYPGIHEKNYTINKVPAGPHN